MNEEFKAFIELPEEAKLVLLKSLGYDVDNKGYILDSNNKKKVICKYSKKPVHFKDASILPGSTIIINTNLITMSQYVCEYLEPCEDL